VRGAKNAHIDVQTAQKRRRNLTEMHDAAKKVKPLG
jgi:hypothetical protein